MKLIPKNGHVWVQPIKIDDFISSTKTSYAEKGVVMGIAKEREGDLTMGQIVFFDSWTAAKYPKDTGTDDFYWLVPYESIRAVEHEDEPISG